jgi:peptidoglycan/LPS O-acetylase OafA/YrhL
MNDRSAPQQNTAWHLGQLDALRGIAILSVMLVHAVYWGPDHILPLRPALLLMIAFAGQRGVQLFFLVSAFTLYMSHSNRRHEARPTLNFFLRRFFRITPMLYVSVALTYFLWP